MNAIVVRQYKTARAFSHDSGDMSRRGYRVASQSMMEKRGCLAPLMFWIPKKTIVVTYERMPAA